MSDSIGIEEFIESDEYLVKELEGIEDDTRALIYYLLEAIKRETPALNSWRTVFGVIQGFFRE